MCCELYLRWSSCVKRTVGDLQEREEVVGGGMYDGGVMGVCF